jgi:hypothetical protein
MHASDCTEDENYPFTVAYPSFSFSQIGQYNKEQPPDGPQAYMVQLVEVRMMASPCLSSNSLVRKLKVNGSSMNLQGEDTVSCNEGLSVSLVPNHLITQE